MALTISNGTQNISGNVTSIPSKTTATSIVASNTNGNTTLGTVGAGKVWRITSAYMSVIKSSLNQTSSLTMGGVVYAQHTGALAAGGMPTINLTWEYGACPVLTAGQTIVQTAGANEYNNCGVTYVEETA